MCGLAGLFTLEPADLAKPLEAANLALRNRGPDDFGFLQWLPGQTAWKGRELRSGLSLVGLVHRRLSILDLSPRGWQPQSTADQRFHLVYNGEIYNYLELRNELEASGHTFQSNSDTEVLLTSLSLYGPSVLPRLVGMFAFLLLDTQEQTVLLARDSFGIKPLYYTRFSGGLGVASEVKALINMGLVSRRLDPQNVYDYLRFGLTEHREQTIFEGVFQVPSASFAIVSLSHPQRLEFKSYWQPQLGSLDISYRESSARMRELFEEAITLHMRSDVPVGVSLSGGIDSSAIAMTVRQLFPRQALHTFSFAALGAPVDESKWSHIVAEAAGSEQHVIQIHPEDLQENLLDLIRTQDHPSSSSSIFASYMLMRQVQSSGIKVILSGQGADEILGGYDLFRGAMLASTLRSRQPGPSLKLLMALCRRPDWKKSLQQAGMFLLPARLEAWLRTWIGRELMPAWLSPKWFLERGVRIQPPTKKANERVLLEELRHTLTYSSLPMLLRYEDRNSMRHSVESRVPFLTTKLVDFAYSLPESHLVSLQGVTKAVFREAMKGVVPDAILQRRDKIGYATPEQDWLKSLAPCVNATLRGGHLDGGPFRPEQARNYCLGAISSGIGSSFASWRILNFLLWVELLDVSYS